VGAVLDSPPPLLVVVVEEVVLFPPEAAPPPGALDETVVGDAPLEHAPRTNALINSTLIKIALVFICYPSRKCLNSPIESQAEASVGSAIRWLI
jgi:hypothetical protein